MKKEIFSQFLQILVDSIMNLEEQYFNFPIAESNPIKRERIYCNELYHLIRNRIHQIPYSINSEPNKKRHPIIEKICGPVDPDLVIHRPGSMDENDNLAVIEMKSSAGDLTNGIKKDMQTINCMTTIENGYYGGILIVFGNISDLRKKNLIKRIEVNKSSETERLILLIHNQVGCEPEIIEF